MAPTFVALLSVLSGSLAYPSFRYKIPNGERVPCPEGAEGCTWTEDDILGLQGSWRCNGLGHSTCAGGGALNAFGVDFVACLLYTSPSPRDKRQSRMPSSA